MNDFLPNKEKFDTPKRGIFHHSNFNAGRVYLLGKNTIQIINIKTGKVIKTISYPKDSLARSWKGYSRYKLPFSINSTGTEVILKLENKTEILNLTSGKTIDKFNTQQLSTLLPLSPSQKTKKHSYSSCPSNQWKCLFDIENNISPNGKYIALGKSGASNVVMETKSEEVGLGLSRRSCRVGVLVRVAFNWNTDHLSNKTKDAFKYTRITAREIRKTLIKD